MNACKPLLNTGLRSAFFLLISCSSLSPSLLANNSQPNSNDCKILPNAVIEQSSNSDGIISNITVTLGQAVEKGQVLATLDNAVERASVELAQQRLNAQRTLTPDSTDTLQVLALELQLAQTKLEQKTVKASATGVISKIYAHEGERLGQQALLQITKLNPLRVSTHINSETIGTLNPENTAKIYDLQGKTLGDAILTSINPVSTSDKGQEVIWTLSTKPANILPGQSCQLASLSTSSDKKAVTSSVTRKKFGPIYSAQRKSQLAEALSQQNYKFTIEETTETRQLGFFVLANGGDNHQQTQAIAKTIIDKGINDIQILPEGEYAGHISLGLAYEMNKAKELQAKLKSLDIVTYIKPRVRQQRAWWLNVETQEVTNLLGSLLAKDTRPPSQ